MGYGRCYSTKKKISVFPCLNDWLYYRNYWKSFERKFLKEVRFLEVQP